jgi:hypothetical protein
MRLNRSKNAHFAVKFAIRPAITPAKGVRINNNRLK